jgi:hypothetical protein
MIEDISSIRIAKINKYLESMQADSLYINLNNVCARELEQIRPFISEAIAMKLEILNCNGTQDEVVPLGNNYSYNSA